MVVKRHPFNQSFTDLTTRAWLVTDAIRLATRRGYRRLTEGGTALDAVETAVQLQEDHPIFNAGKLHSINYYPSA